MAFREVTVIEITVFQAGYLRRLGAHYAKMQAEETNELKANRYGMGTVVRRGTIR